MPRLSNGVRAMLLWCLQLADQCFVVGVDNAGRLELPVVFFEPDYLPLPLALQPGGAVVPAVCQVLLQLCGSCVAAVWQLCVVYQCLGDVGMHCGWWSM